MRFEIDIPNELVPYVTNIPRAIVEHAKDNARREGRKTLIALTSPEAGEGVECDHADGNCFNNDPANLQWLTPEQNRAKGGIKRTDYYGVKVVPLA